MPTGFAQRVLILLTALLLLLVSAAQATHSPTVAEAVATATGLGMRCLTGASQVDCTGPEQYYFREPLGTIRPATGPLHDVDSQVNAHSNGIHDFLTEDRAWMTSLHAVGCSDSESETSAVAAFMDSVAAQLEESSGGTYGPVVVGECTMSGALFLPSPTAQWRWRITSVVTAGAFPPPPPPPTPRPTPVPTPRATPTAVPTPTPTPTPTPSPTPSPSPSPSPTPSPSSSESPEGTVAGIVFSPSPSASPPAAAPIVGDWVESVPDPSDVSTDPIAIASSAVLALLLLLFMGFVGELFNNTAKANYDVLVGWWSASWLGRHLRWFTDFWKAP